MKILHVVGARPNFVKIAPIMYQMAREPQVFEQILVHTGQHYDANMSQVFFEDLSLPRPELDLGVGSGTHAWQTAEIMKRFEPVIHEQKPDLVVVVGDVNSTLASSLVCVKLGIPVAHVEAGLRSFDRSMPEEINRLLTDQIADLLFTHSPEAKQNLLAEGIDDRKIHYVGNVMIDSLVRLESLARPKIKKLNERFELERYILVTIHRDFNVDNPDRLLQILAAMKEISSDIKVIFSVHPRTRRRIDAGHIEVESENFLLVDPLGYLEFLALQAHARLVVTDSGGLQEETTFLGIPCLTVRPNTERPITISTGTNQLVKDPSHLLKFIREVLSKPIPDKPTIPLWDGNASERILEVCKAYFDKVDVHAREV